MKLGEFISTNVEKYLIDYMITSGVDMKIPGDNRLDYALVYCCRTQNKPAQIVYCEL